jgi:hypothetical protein
VAKVHDAAMEMIAVIAKTATHSERTATRMIKTPPAKPPAWNIGAPPYAMTAARYGVPTPKRQYSWIFPCSRVLHRWILDRRQIDSCCFK